MGSYSMQGERRGARTAEERKQDSEERSKRYQQQAKRQRPLREAKEREEPQRPDWMSDRSLLPRKPPRPAT